MTGANGEYAEFFVAPEKNCHILPDEISWSEAGLVDTLAGPAYAAAKLNFPLESSVAVFGPGPAGLFFCALSKLRGAEKVFLVGTREYRLKHGPEYGADRMINVHEEDAVESIKAETEGKGVDIAIEAAGSEQALNGSLSVLKKGGVMLLYGVLGGGPISVDVQPIQLLEYTVLGSATVDYPPAIKLIRTGKIKVQNLVSHRFTLDQLPNAFSSGLIAKRHENYLKGVVLF